MKAELIQKSRREYRCGKCGKVIEAGDEEDEGVYLDDEFDVVFEKDGKSVSFHFEKRTHFDEEAYEEAVDDLRESVREIIGNISE